MCMQIALLVKGIKIIKSQAERSAKSGLCQSRDNITVDGFPYGTKLSRF